MFGFTHLIVVSTRLPFVSTCLRIVYQSFLLAHRSFLLIYCRLPVASRFSTYVHKNIIQIYFFLKKEKKKKKVLHETFVFYN